jgi:Homeodomain-like domain
MRGENKTAPGISQGLLFAQKSVIFLGTKPDIVSYNKYMTEAQELITRLQGRGWTIRAISRELGITDRTVYRWRVGGTAPGPAARVLRQLLSEPVPKRRYRRRNGD